MNPFTFRHSGAALRAAQRRANGDGVPRAVLSYDDRFGTRHYWVAVADALTEAQRQGWHKIVSPRNAGTHAKAGANPANT